MKKITILCCIPFIALTLLLIVAFLIPTQLDYSFKTVKGDISYMKDVEFDLELINTTAYQSDNQTSIEIKQKDGKSNYTINYHVNSKEDERLEKHVEGNLRQDEYVTYASNNEECKIEETAIENQLPVIYSFHNIVDGNHNEMRIDTGMKYVNTEKDQLYNRKVTCDEQEIENGYLKKSTQENEESIVNKLVEKNEKEYYFLPKTTDYMIGQNHVYKINVTKATSFYNSYYGSLSTVMSLPEGRYYDSLELTKDGMYIVCHTQNEQFLMMYDYQGNFIKEKTYSLDLKNAIMYSNDSYLLLSIDDRVIVVDSQTLEVVETCELSKYRIKNSYAGDMIYKNDTLYIFYDIFADSINNKASVFMLQAIKDGKLVYKGNLDSYANLNFNNNEQFYLYKWDASFKRDSL